MTFGRAASLVLALGATGCNWISLARNAYSYTTLAGGDAGNVAVYRDTLAYVTLAETGFAVVDVRTGRTMATIAPPAGVESADDVAVADDVLFVLDARPPGHLTAYSLADGARPVMISRPVEVPVGPFSGVSASKGLCVVSGGTSRLTAWQYDAAGVLRGPLATADLGRGQPDVLLTPNGFAYVSTHYWGPYFGLDVIRVARGRGSLPPLSELHLDGAGFTEGGAKPANFPIEMAQLDDRTLLIAFARGVAVIDVTQPASPRLVRVVDVGGAGVNVDASGGFAAVLVTGDTPAVAILDSTARVIRRIGLPPGTNPSAVALSGARADRVVIAARERGVMVLSR